MLPMAVTRGPRLGVWVATTMLAAGVALAEPDTGLESGANLDVYRQKGLEAALQLKGALGSQLKQAMAAGGSEGAVAFCNARALSITRETSNSLGTQVVRVSDRPRNPANAANAHELAVIARFKDALAAGDKPSPQLDARGEQVIGYYPIVTNGMCLKCHGQPGADITSATQAVIDSRYPQDQATGYAENELRGLFVVTMERDAEGPAD